MEKADYVGVYWCGVDIVPEYEYKYFSHVTYNEAAWDTRQLSDEVSLQEHHNEIYDALTEELGDGLGVSSFADAYEKVMFDFEAFAVYKVLPETPREAIEDEFDSNPENFILHWCVREG